MEYLIQQFLAQNNLTGVNGIDYTLRDDGQGSYVDKWTYNIPKPVFNSDDLLEGQLLEAKKAKINQCKSYLTSTDWYVVRKADNGTVIPSEISTNRELARTLQEDINSITIDEEYFNQDGKPITALEELNAINIEF